MRIVSGRGVCKWIHPQDTDEDITRHTRQEQLDTEKIPNQQGRHHKDGHEIWKHLRGPSIQEMMLMFLK